MAISVERKLAGYGKVALGCGFKGARVVKKRSCLSRVIAPLLALCIGLAATFATPAAAGPTGLAGTWDTNWGQLVVYAENDRYFGHYVPSSGATDDTGDVTFVPSGGALTGYWVEPNANERCNITKMGTYYWGRVVLDQPITSDGFAVKWGYCANGPLDRVWTFNHKTSEPTNAGTGAGTSAQTGQVANGENSLSFAGNPVIEDGRIVLHPGDKFDVGFTAEDGLHDRSWIGIVADNAVEDPTPFHTAANDLKTRTSGTLTSEAPRTLGDYRLWMYDAWNRKRLVDLPVRIEVDKNSAGLSLPGGNELEPGQSFDVDFTASPNYSYYNWVAVVAADTPVDMAQEDVPEFHGKFYLKNQSAGRLTFTAPTAPGRYLLRMQDQEFKTTLAELDLVVAKPPSEDAPEPTELGASSAGNTPTPSGTGQDTGIGADGKPKPSSEEGFRDVVTDLTSLGFQPMPSSAGNPDTEVKISHLEVVTIGIGPSIEFATLRRNYILSEDKRSSSFDAGNDVQAVDKYGGFAYLDFSTDGNDDAMTALAGENGIDCTSEAKRPRLDGNVFSYQLNFHQAYNDQAISYECVLDLVGVINPNGKSVSLWLKYKGLQLSWVNDFNRPDKWDWIKNTEVSYKITDLPLSSATQFDNYACLTFSADSLASRHYVKITDIYEQERSYYPHPGTDIEPIDTPEDLMVRQPMQIWWSADPSEPDTGIKVELCGAP